MLIFGREFVTLLALYYALLCVVTVDGMRLRMRSRRRHERPRHRAIGGLRRLIIQGFERAWERGWHGRHDDDLPPYPPQQEPPYSRPKERSPVFCYWNANSTDRPKGYTFDKIPARLCSHAVYADKDVDNGGQGFESYSLNTETRTQIAELKKKNPALSLLLRLSNTKRNRRFFCKWFGFRRRKAASYLLSWLQKYNFDGVDINVSCRNRRTFADMVHEIHEAFVRKEKTVVFTVELQRNSEERKYDHYRDEAYGDIRSDVQSDLFDLVRYVDYINVEYRLEDARDLHNEWEDFEYDLQEVARDGVAKEKIIVQLPFFGRTFNLSGVDHHHPWFTLERLQEHFREYRGGTLPYAEICKRLGEGWTRRWDEQGLRPYAFKNRELVVYEDSESISAKLQSIKQDGYGGVSVWTVDMDDRAGSCGRRNDLVKTIQEELNDMRIATAAPSTTSLATTKARKPARQRTTHGVTPPPKVPTPVTRVTAGILTSSTARQSNVTTGGVTSSVRKEASRETDGRSTPSFSRRTTASLPRLPTTASKVPITQIKLLEVTGVGTTPLSPGVTEGTGAATVKRSTLSFPATTSLALGQTTASSEAHRTEEKPVNVPVPGYTSTSDSGIAEGTSTVAVESSTPLLHRRTTLSHLGTQTTSLEMPSAQINPVNITDIDATTTTTPSSTTRESRTVTVKSPMSSFSRKTTPFPASPTSSYVSGTQTPSVNDVTEIENATPSDVPSARDMVANVTLVENEPSPVSGVAGDTSADTTGHSIFRSTAASTLGVTTTTTETTGTQDDSANVTDLYDATATRSGATMDTTTVAEVRSPPSFSRSTAEPALGPPTTHSETHSTQEEPVSVTDVDGATAPDVGVVKDPSTATAERPTPSFFRSTPSWTLRVPTTSAETPHSQEERAKVTEVGGTIAPAPSATKDTSPVSTEVSTPYFFRSATESALGFSAMSVQMSSTLKKVENVSDVYITTAPASGVTTDSITAITERSTPDLFRNTAASNLGVLTTSAEIPNAQEKVVDVSGLDVATASSSDMTNDTHEVATERYTPSFFRSTSASNLGVDVTSTTTRSMQHESVNVSDTDATASHISGATEDKSTVTAERLTLSFLRSTKPFTLGMHTTSTKMPSTQDKALNAPDVDATTASTSITTKNTSTTIVERSTPAFRSTTASTLSVPTTSTETTSTKNEFVNASGATKDASAASEDCRPTFFRSTAASSLSLSTTSTNTRTTKDEFVDLSEVDTGIPHVTGATKDTIRVTKEHTAPSFFRNTTASTLHQPVTSTDTNSTQGEAVNTLDVDAATTRASGATNDTSARIAKHSTSAFFRSTTASTLGVPTTSTETSSLQDESMNWWNINARTAAASGMTKGTSALTTERSLPAFFRSTVTSTLGVTTASMEKPSTQDEPVNVSDVDATTAHVLGMTKDKGTLTAGRSTPPFFMTTDASTLGMPVTPTKMPSMQDKNVNVSDENSTTTPGSGETKDTSTMIAKRSTPAFFRSTAVSTLDVPTSTEMPSSQDESVNVRDRNATIAPASGVMNSTSPLTTEQFMPAFFRSTATSTLGVHTASTEAPRTQDQPVHVSDVGATTAYVSGAMSDTGTLAVEHSTPSVFRTTPASTLGLPTTSVEVHRTQDEPVQFSDVDVTTAHVPGELTDTGTLIVEHSTPAFFRTAAASTLDLPTTSEEAPRTQDEPAHVSDVDAITAHASGGMTDTGTLTIEHSTPSFFRTTHASTLDLPTTSEVASRTQDEPVHVSDVDATTAHVSGELTDTGTLTVEHSTPAFFRTAALSTLDLPTTSEEAPRTQDEPAHVSDVDAITAHVSGGMTDTGTLTVEHSTPSFFRTTPASTLDLPTTSEVASPTQDEPVQFSDVDATTAHVSGELTDTGTLTVEHSTPAFFRTAAASTLDLPTTSEEAPHTQDERAHVSDVDATTARVSGEITDTGTLTVEHSTPSFFRTTPVSSLDLPTTSEEASRTQDEPVHVSDVDATTAHFRGELTDTGTLTVGHSTPPFFRTTAASTLELPMTSHQASHTQDEPAHVSDVDATTAHMSGEMLGTGTLTVQHSIPSFFRTTAPSTLDLPTTSEEASRTQDEPAHASDVDATTAHVSGKMTDTGTLTVVHSTPSFIRTTAASTLGLPMTKMPSMQAKGLSLSDIGARTSASGMTKYTSTMTTERSKPPFFISTAVSTFGTRTTSMETSSMQEEPVSVSDIDTTTAHVSGVTKDTSSPQAEQSTRLSPVETPRMGSTVFTAEQHAISEATNEVTPSTPDSNPTTKGHPADTTQGSPVAFDRVTSDTMSSPSLSSANQSTNQVDTLTQVAGVSTVGLAGTVDILPSQPTTAEHNATSSNSPQHLSSTKLDNTNTPPFHTTRSSASTPATASSSATSERGTTHNRAAGVLVPDSEACKNTTAMLVPHENDCTKFYYCQGGRAYRHDCPDNSVFDTRLLVCNWRESVNRPECRT